MKIELPNTCDKCETPEARGPVLYMDQVTLTATCSNCGYVHKGIVRHSPVGIIPGKYGIVTVEQPVVQRGTVCLSFSGRFGEKDKILMEREELTEVIETLTAIRDAL